MDQPTSGAIGRRTFLQRASLVAGVAAVSPFAFVRDATARSRPALHRFVREQMLASLSPGVGVAVVRGDEVAWATGAGWADREQGIHAKPDTAFMLASVSKTVTCAGVMALVEDGLLDLDADVSDVLPFEVHVPSAPHAAVTTRMLLTHTSAIRDRYSVWGTPTSHDTLYFHGDSPITLGDFESSYLVPGSSRYREGANFYERRPGTAYAYSNIAVALAGYVAEVVSGVDFDAWCLQRILTPLGIDDSGYRLADLTSTNLAMPYAIDHRTGEATPYYQYGYPDYPDGALRTSAMHLATWLGAFMNHGAFGGVRVLDHATVREIRRNQLPDLVSWHQGLIWYGNSPNGYFRMGHTGGDFGMTTRMFFRPDTQVGVVSLANAYLGGPRWDAFRAIELRLLDEFS